MFNEVTAVLYAPAFVRLRLRDGRETTVACASRLAAEHYVHWIPFRQVHADPADPEDRLIQAVASALIVPSLLSIG